MTTYQPSIGLFLGFFSSMVRLMNHVTKIFRVEYKALWHAVLVIQCWLLFVSHQYVRSSCKFLNETLTKSCKHPRLDHVEITYIVQMFWISLLILDMQIYLVFKQHFYFSCNIGSIRCVISLFWNTCEWILTLIKAFLSPDATIQQRLAWQWMLTYLEVGSCMLSKFVGLSLLKQ